MADLYGTNPRSSSSSESFESEEMSSFLQNYLNNSSIKGKNVQGFTSQQPPPIAAGFSDSDGRVSDLSGYYPKEILTKSFSSNATTSLNFPLHDDVAGFDFGCQVQKATEAQKNPIPPRSSKRTRAAEIHNMSEKRRRSRINEKLKALQTLIPNSNKTDKASMLDEAIEYLKQLQLQVQTLTMKTGLGLPPIYVQELAIQRGMGYDETNKSANPNVGGGTFPQDQNIPILREFDISHHSSMPSLTNMMKSETPFGLELPTENQHGFLNHLTSMKDIYRVNRPSKLATDLPFSGKIPSPGVSS